MTRKQQRLQNRDKEIISLADSVPVEELAQKYDLSLPTIYRILRRAI